MAVFLMNGSGGMDVSDANAKPNQVLGGATFYSENNEGLEVQEGSMKNNGAVRPDALNCGESYTIPEGYHNGMGRVTANNLASQTVVTANKEITADKVLSEFEGWVLGNKIVGSMENNGAVAPGGLNPGDTYTIPEGYHNGSGKVTANKNNGTYTLSVTGDKIDMGELSSNRYIKTSGLYTAAQYNNNYNTGYNAGVASVGKKGGFAGTVNVSGAGTYAEPKKATCSLSFSCASNPSYVAVIIPEVIWNYTNIESGQNISVSNKGNFVASSNCYVNLSKTYANGVCTITLTLGDWVQKVSNSVYVVAY